MVLDEVVAEQHRQLERVRELVGAVAPGRVGVDQARDVEAPPVRAEAVALHHQLGGALERDRRPDGRPHRVHRHGDFADLGPELAEDGCGAPHAGVDVLLRVVMSEAFLDEADPEAVDAPPERLGVGRGPRRVLTRIEAVGAGEHLEQQCIVGHGRGHRPGVVERQLDRHDARVGHEAVRGLHAVDAAIRRRNADRAALIAADRHVHFAGGHERGRAR